MRKTFYPETRALVKDSKASVAKDHYVLKNSKEVFKHGKIPIWAALPADFHRYLKAQKRRMERGQRCNLSKGYLKEFASTAKR